MNITVVGTGYVGLSNAILLAQHNKVVALDVVEEKVKVVDDFEKRLKKKGYELPFFERVDDK